MSSSTNSVVVVLVTLPSGSVYVVLVVTLPLGFVVEVDEDEKLPPSYPKILSKSGKLDGSNSFGSNSKGC